MKKFLLLIVAVSILLLPKPKAYAAVLSCSYSSSWGSPVEFNTFQEAQGEIIAVNTGTQPIRAYRLTIPSGFSFNTAAWSGGGTQGISLTQYNFVDGYNAPGATAYLTIDVTAGNSLLSDSPITLEGSVDDGATWFTCDGSFLMGINVVSGPTPFPQGGSYTPDQGTLDAMTGLLSSMVSVVFTIIPVVIGIVGTLVVTLFAIKHLRGFFWKFQKWTRGKKHKK